eukprot:scaffold78003_cov21-Tisochrysis_lutea.AAC.1
MPLVFLQALTIHMVDHVKAADWVIPPSLIHPNSAAAVAAAAAAALQRTRRAADDEEDEGVGRRQRGGGGGGGGGVEAAAPEVEVDAMQSKWPGFLKRLGKCAFSCLAATGKVHA